jgi:hypothetical protein
MLAWTQLRNRARLSAAPPPTPDAIGDQPAERRDSQGKPRVMPGTSDLAVHKENTGFPGQAEIFAFYGVTRLALLALMVASAFWPENGGPIRSVEDVSNRLGPVVMSNPRLLRGFGNWDANHFLQIAGGGYSDTSLPAFFPLYPLLLHVLSLGHPAVLIVLGVLVNLVLSGAAIVLFARSWLLITPPWSGRLA